LAQAPNISYTPSTNSYPVGSTITPLVPTNGGGAVPATVYSTVSTYAGTGATGTTNGALNVARFNTPRWTTFDYTNNLMYVADATNNLIRKINITTGAVTTYAGTGVAGSTNGALLTAKFDAPYAITYDGTGILYVVDYTTNLVRKIVVSTGTVSTLATLSGTAGPAGIVYDPTSAALYVTCSANNTIVKVTTTGTATVYAGSGTAALTDGTGAAAAFDQPNGITVDGSGNLYVADQLNNAIRKIAPGGVVTTFATGFNSPRGIDIDVSGNFYVSDNNNQINLVSPAGIITAIAGDGNANLLNGVGTASEFNQSRGVSVYRTTGDIYVSDYSNNVIRKIIGTGYLISPTLPGGLSFASTTGTITGNPTASSPPTDYTVTAFNASGSSSTIVNIACAQTIDWIGGNGANGIKWARTNNWSSGTIPTAADNVRIGVVNFTGGQPTISSIVTVNSITFGSAKIATLTIANNDSLYVAGNITVNTAATATITGAGDLDLTPGATVNVNGTKLTISANSLTLESDASGSASIGPVTTTNFITSGTTVNVQRYVTGGSSTYRGYRLLSSPVHTGTAHGNSVYDFGYVKASAYVLGTTGTGSGFDKTGNPTIFLFQENQVPSSSAYGAGNWPGVSKINTTFNLQLNGVATTYNLPIGNGFLFFFRGDRNAAAIGTETVATYVPTGTTFTATGTLNVGTVTVKDWFTPTSTNLSFDNLIANTAVRGYTLAGNPYPSNIDWNNFSATNNASPIYGPNTDGSLYMLDPISKNYGVYNGGVGTNNATNIIPSGVGFFVRATAAGASLVINESAKTTTQAIGPALMLGRPVIASQSQYLHLKMALDSINSDETMVRIQSNAGTNFINGSDALYKTGYGTVSLATHTSDNVDIAIKSMALPNLQPKKLALNVNANTNGIYYLTLKDVVAIPQLYDIWLMDAYKKDSLDMRQNKTYGFNINKADSTSFGPGRFTLVIRQNAAYAYRLISFTANKATTGRQVEVKWEAQNEANYTNFTVQRSTDGGKTFNILGGVTANGQGNYSFLDKSPVNGQNLYRLQQQDVNNTISYSKIVTIEYANLGDKISDIILFPNPANSIINLGINVNLTGTALYNIKVMNSSGVIVKEVNSTQPSWQGSISNLQPGTYLVRVTNNQTQAFIGESKFVKL
jgi:hypothetical protein